jgi:hypothetical protein
MSDKKVLHRSHLPSKLPLGITCVAYLMLDKFNAVGWVWGAVGLLFALIWIAAIVAVVNEESVKLKELE